MFLDQGLPHFLFAKLETFPQLISNEVSDYASTFLNNVIFNFWKVLNFSPLTTGDFC